MAKGRSVTSDTADTMSHAPAWKANGRPASARTKEIAAPKPMKTAMKAFEWSSSTNENTINATQNKTASMNRSIWPVPKTGQFIDVTASSRDVLG